MGTIIVGITTYPVVFTFPVLWNGWENDNTGYIVMDDDVKRLVLTNHGSPYFGNISELQEKIKEYEEAATETKKAILLIE